MEYPTTIKEVFDNACRHLEINHDLIRRLERYKIEFITKNKSHAEFFGSNLTGCYPVKYTPLDRDKLFYDILKIDEKDIDKSCDRIIPKKQYNVAGDNGNLALVWLAHSIRKSSLPEKDKVNGQAICMEIMQYKFFTSRLFRHWKYPCTVAEAEATLAALNNKFIIKQKTSWNQYFRDRAEEVIDPKSKVHNETLDSMSVDMRKPGEKGQSTAYLITDMQSRIRDMLKNIFNVFLQVHDSGKKISGQSKVGVFEGETSLKDDIKSQTKYTQYLHTITPDKFSFVKVDLGEVITRAIPTINEKAFYTTLYFISKEYNNNQSKIPELLDLVLEQAFTYLSVNNDYHRNKDDLSYLLSKMKGIYSSSRSQDKQLHEVRERMEKLVKDATKSKVPAVIASTRTGVLLYILLRVFTMNYYSN